MADTDESTARCVWTGAEFPAAAPGGRIKKFASATVRAEAHMACRQYAEHLIAEGFLDWNTVRKWWDGKQARRASNTTLGAASGHMAAE